MHGDGETNPQVPLTINNMTIFPPCIICIIIFSLDVLGAVYGDRRGGENDNYRIREIASI